MGSSRQSSRVFNKTKIDWDTQCHGQLALRAQFMLRLCTTHYIRLRQVDNQGV